MCAMMLQWQAECVVMLLCMCCGSVSLRRFASGAMSVDCVSFEVMQCGSPVPGNGVSRTVFR